MQQKLSSSGIRVLIMEKINFVKNGVLRLPPGFRFHPTDQELVLQYLKRKVFSCPLPASFIPQIDVCKFDPWDLPGNTEQERYFFSTREVKYPNGKRSNRATGSGYWKATGLDKNIVTSRGNEAQAVGKKKTLVFYRGKPPHGSRTDWIMHEYRLVTPSPQAQLDKWVLCRIFLKKRGCADDNKSQPQNSRKKKNNRRPLFYNFMAKDRTRATTDLNLAPTSSSSSGSSGITEASSDDPEEASSTSCNSLATFRRKT